MKTKKQERLKQSGNNVSPPAHKLEKINYRNHLNNEPNTPIDLRLLFFGGLITNRCN